MLSKWTKTYADLYNFTLTERKAGTESFIRLKIRHKMKHKRSFLRIGEHKNSLPPKNGVYVLSCLSNFDFDHKCDNIEIRIRPLLGHTDEVIPMNLEPLIYGIKCIVKKRIIEEPRNSTKSLDKLSKKVLSDGEKIMQISTYLSKLN